MVTEKGPKWGWFASDEQEEGQCGRRWAYEVSPGLQARTRVRCLEFKYNWEPTGRFSVGDWHHLCNWHPTVWDAFVYLVKNFSKGPVASSSMLLSEAPAPVKVPKILVCKGLFSGKEDSLPLENKNMKGSVQEPQNQLNRQLIPGSWTWGSRRWMCRWERTWLRRDSDEGLGQESFKT